MRYADIALLLVPVGLLIAWFSGVRGLSPRGALATLALLAVIATALLWLGQHRAFTGSYEPAHLKAGHIQPPHSG